MTKNPLTKKQMDRFIRFCHAFRQISETQSDWLSIRSLTLAAKYPESYSTKIRDALKHYEQLGLFEKSRASKPWFVWRPTVLGWQYFSFIRSLNTLCEKIRSIK